MDEETFKGVELEITPEIQADIDTLIASRADLSDEELEVHLVELLRTKDGDRPRRSGVKIYSAYCSYHGYIAETVTFAKLQELIEEHKETPGMHAVRPYIDEP